MRNNQERLENNSDQTDSKQSPSFINKDEKFSFPSLNSAYSEFVDLPTEGKYYGEGSTLFQKSKLEIYFMTTRHEEILNNKNYQQQGTMIDKFLRSIIVDQSINIDELYATDKSAILIAARKTGIGALYETNIMCPQCQKTSEKQFDLREISIKETEANISENGTFDVRLLVEPNEEESEQNPKLATVTFRLLTSKDEYNLLESEKRKKKHKLKHTPIKDLLSCIIYAVNHNQNRSFIDSFIDMLLVKHGKWLRTQYAELCPNLDTNFFFECPNCSYEGEVPMPIGVNFFWGS